MNISFKTRFLATLLIGMMTISASANSVSLDSGVYTPNTSGHISVSVQYDFTVYSMFGGGLNLIYDASAIEFVSFTQDDFSDSTAIPAFSPNGALTEAGFYEGFGISAGKFFNGIINAGSMGVFIFTVIGSGDGLFDGCVNGATLCLTPNLPINPMVSLAGQDVTEDIFSNVEGINASVLVPLPASLWFLLSGLFGLLSFRRQPA